MSVDNSNRYRTNSLQIRPSNPTLQVALHTSTLLRGYCGWHRRTTRQQQQLELISTGLDMSQHRLAVGAGGVNKAQATLTLMPSLPLTARYYATHKKTQAAADKPLGHTGDADADKAAGVCKRYPFSQVIYSNILTSNDSIVDVSGKPVNKQRLKLAQPPLLSYLPKPGGLPVPSSSSSARSPSFIHRRRVARERSSVSGPLDRALASDRSSEVVVRRAITQLRDVMHLPQPK